jgi:hypothetical protein
VCQTSVFINPLTNYVSTPEQLFIKFNNVNLSTQSIIKAVIKHELINTLPKKHPPPKNTPAQIEFLKVINRSSKCLSASMHIIYQPFHKFTNKNVLARKM